MKTRLLGVCVVGLLGLAILSAPVSAQQVGPAGGNAQVDQYISPEETTGARGDPGEAGAGATGQLPFTGWALLPLTLVGISLVFAALALRRRREDGGSSHAA